MTMIVPPSAPRLRSVDWKPGTPGQSNRSEFTGRRRVTILPQAPRWKAKAVLPPILGEQNVLAWRAWILDLQGIANSFPLVAVENVQIAGVSPTVTTAGQIGLAVNSAGWGAAGLKLRRGQFVTIADQLLPLAADVVAEADGSAHLTFSRYIRVPTIAGAPIVADLPYARMSLTDPDTGWMADVGQTYAISVDCEEWF